jgi:hypothetical protein
MYGARRSKQETGGSGTPPETREERQKTRQEASSPEAGISSPKAGGAPPVPSPKMIPLTLLRDDALRGWSEDVAAHVTDVPAPVCLVPCFDAYLIERFFEKEGSVA